MNSYLLRVWGLWDRIYYYSSRLQYVEKGENLFRVVLMPYWDRTPLYTRSGTMISKGDLVVKLHIHNYKLAKILFERKGAHALGLILLREIRRSLPGLVRFIDHHPNREQIKGIVGTTFLYRGAENLGFTVYSPPLTLKMRIKNWYLRWMMRMVHPQGKDRLDRQAEPLMVRRVFMSKAELYRYYA
ncbi:MAG: hypothetical protein IMW85_01945 [Thermicanus sp.]|nr:hypothetical protein [Thermicanus sp.]